MSTILAIDQGTTNTKALLFSQRGEVLAQSARPVALTYPRPGWVEQSPDAIWETVREVALDCVREAGPGAIAALAIANQRESVLLWQRDTGAALGPCVSWQCRRSSDQIDRLRGGDVEQRVHGRTGLGLDPLFPASKIAWLLDAVPGARALAAAGILCAGTIDSWLLFNLTAGEVHATDHGNASRTQLFDIGRLSWDEELGEIFDVPLSVMPQVRPSDSRFGMTAPASGLPAGIPIHAMMGDSHAALYGHGIREPGLIKATLGTGSSLMTLTGGAGPARNGLSKTIAWSTGGEIRHAVEGNISVSGQAAAFVAGLLGLADAGALAELAMTVPDAAGVSVVPAFAGLGAPYWDDRARGLFSGMTLATTRAHLARATLDAIAHQIADVLDAMASETAVLPDRLRVDGGASTNDALLQILADIAGVAVERGTLPELSAFGAAGMAGIASGQWSEGAVRAVAGATAGIVRPRLPDHARAAARAEWAQAVARARFKGGHPGSGATH